MSHWMQRVATQAGLPRAAELTLPDGAGVTDVWAHASAICGVGMAELAQAVAATFRMPVADLTSAVPAASKLIPASLAQKLMVFPLQVRDRSIQVATADPSDLNAEKEIGFASGRTPELVVASPEDIRAAITATYSPEGAAEQLISMVRDAESDLVALAEQEPTPEPVSEADTAAEPVVRLTNIILQDAITQGASDIHVQPTAAGAVVRYRVDGVLRTAMQLPSSLLAKVVSRIKIMGRLDIADRIRPQDGRARLIKQGQRYDLRISTVPTRNAEKVVIRILDPGKGGNLDDTGIAPEEVARIRRVLAQRDGIFVVSGPTGSGKTSTLYAALREISTEGVNIMTVEDPVEYELSGLTQIQVEPKQGVTFASALRAILRQDPDVIFVGEIRDGETAGIAAQASLTGHLVLATLHTNDAVGVIRRFVDLGLDATTLMTTIRGTLAQRLIRKACRACAVPAAPPLTPTERTLSDRYGTLPVLRAPGCERCGGTGYQGRKPVTEFMTLTPELARLVSQGASPLELLKQARADGMRTLLESALDLMRAGETTLEEVDRVIGETERNPDEASTARAPRPSVATEEKPRESIEVKAIPHVLVVDDDAVNRTLARALLEKEHYSVTEATDGSEALVHLARGVDLDLMVLDLDMPTLGGREVLKAVRGSVRTAGLPVVVLTGSSSPELEIELMEQGADDYIRKPLDPLRFIARVKATLRRASM
jgi:type II secretory ATPase GspE/PulE/Tfp pilus assembly ATPase PilB-like protein/ActR/RegA family two-component response regulator